MKLTIPHCIDVPLKNFSQPPSRIPQVKNCGEVFGDGTSQWLSESTPCAAAEPLSMATRVSIYLHHVSERAGLCGYCCGLEYLGGCFPYLLDLGH